ncbi:hypothetical protein V7161_19230 [Neobacillus drentensis]|uniref:hypothetical protein n=1 Tax=Neobacillus drentensis TaxID=220684 RepID=UPI0030015B5C
MTVEDILEDKRGDQIIVLYSGGATSGRVVAVNGGVLTLANTVTFVPGYPGAPAIEPVVFIPLNQITAILDDISGFPTTE